MAQVTIRTPLPGQHNSPGQPLTVTADVTDLEPGSYILQVSAIGLSSVAEQRVAFEQDAPPAPSFIPLYGSGYGSQQFNQGPPCWLDPRDIPAPVPWRVYADKAKRILAHSQQGVRPARWTKICPWGQAGGLYGRHPQLHNGMHEQILANLGDDPLLGIILGLPKQHITSGPRGNGLFSPYAASHPHPSIHTPTNLRMPHWMTIRMDGMVILEESDQYVREMRTVPGALGPFDFSFDPADPTVFYVASTMNGLIIRADRKRAIAARPPQGLEDAALWDFSTFAAGLTKPTSCHAPGDGFLYVCDEVPGRLIRYELSTGTATGMIALSGAFWVDSLSDGRLAIATDKSEVFIYSPLTGTVSSDLLAPANIYKPATPFQNIFVMLTVDRNGTCGPRDEILWCRTHGLGNVDLYQIRGGGAQVLYARQAFNMTGGGVMGQGPMSDCLDAWGHYPWIVQYHSDQALIKTQGNSNTVPTLLIPSQSHIAQPDTYDADLALLGREILQVGTAGHEYKEPSFTCMMNDFGYGYVGADHIADMDFAQMVTFVQQGMLGHVPRPELTGRHLLGLLYYLCRSSQRFLEEGAPFMQSLRDHIGPVSSVSHPFIIPGSVTTGEQHVKPTATRLTFQDIYEHTVQPEPGASFALHVHTGPGTVGQSILCKSPFTYNLALPPGKYGLDVTYLGGGTRLYKNCTNVIEVT